MKSPSFSAPEKFNDAKIGLKVLKENSPNKIIVGHLNINSRWIHFLQHNLC